ncbi:MAG: copper resistance protein [Meiothermus sp.]
MDHSHEGSTTEIITRTLLYLGVFAQVGVGFFARWIGPELAQNRRALRMVLPFGGALLAVGSSLYLAYHIVWMLGGPTREVYLSYLTQTQQGNLLLARVLLVVALLGNELGPAARRNQPLDKVVFSLTALALLATLTLTAHAGARGGVALLSHLVHTAAVVAWGGSLLALGLLWNGRPETLAAVERLSRLGGVAVILFVLSGSLLALTHLSGFAISPPRAAANLTASAYGLALVRKLLGVAAVLGIAAFNRWWLLPRTRRAWLGRLVRLEALILLGVLVLTGFLAATSPPPTGLFDGDVGLVAGLPLDGAADGRGLR